MLAPGEIIGGRYRLLRRLGEGGMGVVWAAVDELFGRDVAVKVMLPALVASDRTAVERFFDEARICRTLRHAGVVDVLGEGRTDEGTPFLVMELLEGDALDAILQRTRTMRPLDVLPIARDVARTLAIAHAKGVIHRDIKPGNVFVHRLASGGVAAKLLDFGISKVTRPSGWATRTHAGTLVGSPAYMSPEQAAGRVELDGRSDVYALGVVLYEALGGRLPFIGDNYNALVVDIAVRDPPSLASIAPGLPKPVLDLVRAAMARERNVRIGSAAALADRIEATLIALGASRAHPLPDPASIEADANASAPHVAIVDTRSALSTSARSSPRRAAPWLALTAIAGAIALGVVEARIAIEARRRRAPAAAIEAAARLPVDHGDASADHASDAPPSPVTSPSAVPKAPARRPVRKKRGAGM